MTVTALHVIPLVVVSNAKRMRTVFISNIIWLLFGPNCKVFWPASYPGERSLSGNVIQSQPGLCSIVKTLYKYVFLITADADETCVFLPAISQSFGPICALLADCIAKAIKVAPARVTDIYM